MNCWRRKAGGGDWHQPPPPASYSPFRSGICGLFTEQCRRTGSKLWSLNSLWLFGREVRTSNMACDLFMLHRLSWCSVAHTPPPNGRFSRLCQTDQAALGKTQTIFCLLAQCQQSMALWMEKISMLQLVLLLGFKSHRGRRVGADVGMENESSDGFIWTLLASSVYFPQLIHKPRESNSKDFARTLKHQIYQISL